MRLLSFFMRQSTSPPQQHICITISTTINPFSQEVVKKENEWRCCFLQYWVTQEPNRISFSTDFWNWKENALKKTWALWIHEIYNYRAACDWLSSLYLQKCNKWEFQTWVSGNLSPCLASFGTFKGIINKHVLSLKQYDNYQNFVKDFYNSETSLGLWFLQSWKV